MFQSGMNLYNGQFDFPRIRPDVAPDHFLSPSSQTYQLAKHQERGFPQTMHLRFPRPVRQGLPSTVLAQSMSPSPGAMGGYVREISPKGAQSIYFYTSFLP